MQFDEAQPPRQWASLVFYVYVLLLVVQFCAGALIMSGTTKLGGQLFLGVVGMALPNVALAAFFALALAPAKAGESALCVDEKIALSNFALLAVALGATDLVFYLLHAFGHGAKRSLQPSETFGDSGTSYTAAILAMLASAAILGYAAIDVVSVYCNEGSRPSTVTFDGKGVVRVEEEQRENAENLKEA